MSKLSKLSQPPEPVQEANLKSGMLITVLWSDHNYWPAVVELDNPPTNLKIRDNQICVKFLEKPFRAGVVDKKKVFKFSQDAECFKIGSSNYKKRVDEACRNGQYYLANDKFPEIGLESTKRSRTTANKKKKASKTGARKNNKASKHRVNDDDEVTESESEKVEVQQVVGRKRERRDKELNPAKSDRKRSKYMPTVFDELGQQIPYAGNRILPRPSPEIRLPMCPNIHDKEAPENKIKTIANHELKNGLKFYIKFKDAETWLAAETIMELNAEEPLHDYLRNLMKEKYRSFEYITKKWPQLRDLAYNLKGWEELPKMPVQEETERIKRIHERKISNRRSTKKA